MEEEAHKSRCEAFSSSNSTMDYLKLGNLHPPQCEPLCLDWLGLLPPLYSFFLHISLLMRVVFFYCWKLLKWDEEQTCLWSSCLVQGYWDVWESKEYGNRIMSLGLTKVIQKWENQAYYDARECQFTICVDVYKY